MFFLSFSTHPPYNGNRAHRRGKWAILVFLAKTIPWYSDEKPKLWRFAKPR